MEFNLEADIEKFNATMIGVADTLGVTSWYHSAKHGKKFLKYQAGLLAQTLMNISGPKNRAASGKAIEARVRGKFHLLASENPHDYHDGGVSDVNWYAFQPNAIFGVKKDCDKTSFTVDQLLKYFIEVKVNNNGRIVAGKHGKQTVYIWQKVTTLEKTAEGVIKKLKARLGRQKASWMPAWILLGAPTGIYSPPEWVKKHLSGARGWGEDRLSETDNPAFMLVSFAKGIGYSQERIRHALDIRMKAMVKDMQLIIAGKKRGGWNYRLD